MLQIYPNSPFLYCFYVALWLASPTSFIRAPRIGMSMKLFPGACIKHWWLYHYGQ